MPTFRGTNGSDVINRSASTLDWELFGLRGEDFIFGGSGNDFANGGADNDFIDGGDGRDAIDAGPGDDIVTAIIARGKAVVRCGEGVDTVIESQYAGNRKRVKIGSDCEKRKRA